MSYLLDNTTKVDDVSVAYLLDFAELNKDSSNYWIFTSEAFHKLARRCGFSILKSSRVFFREDKISNAVDTAYGEQELLLLERV